VCSNPGLGAAVYQLWASCSHRCATVTEQYNLVLAKRQRYYEAGRVTGRLVDRTSSWSQVCVCVCPETKDQCHSCDPFLPTTLVDHVDHSVGFVQTITFEVELNDVWTRHLAWWFIMTFTMSGSKVKVTVRFQAHRRKNIAKVVGATWSEWCLVYLLQHWLKFSEAIKSNTNPLLLHFTIITHTRYGHTGGLYATASEAM